MFRGLKPLRTYNRGNGSASLVGRKTTLPTNAPTHAAALLRQLHPPRHLPLGQILFLLLLGRTMFVERSIMSQLRKPRKLWMWSLVHFSAVVLFDSGALHSFISTAYVENRNLPIALLRCQMIVSSPAGDMPTRQLCPKVNLKIRGRLYRQPYSLGIEGHRRHTWYGLVM
jgi:hypothetical protein